MQKVGTESKAPINLSILQVDEVDQFRFHIIKCVLQHNGIVVRVDLFTTNAAECINSQLKSWEKKKKDPYNFAASYEYII